MSSGPEHYRMAERLIASQILGPDANPDGSGSPFVRTDEPEVIAAAQVFASLAVAAATATGALFDDNDFGRRSSALDNAEAWVDVTKPGPGDRAQGGGT